MSLPDSERPVLLHSHPAYSAAFADALRSVSRLFVMLLARVLVVAGVANLGLRLVRSWAAAAGLTDLERQAREGNIMALRTRIFLRAASLLVLLVAGTCAAVLTLVMDCDGLEKYGPGAIRVVLIIGGATLLLGLAISAWVTRVTTREVAVATEALRQGEERFRSLVENLPVGIYRNTPGPDGRFVTANPASARMHGYDSIEEFLRVRVADLYADPSQRKDLSDKLIARGRLEQEEIRLRRKDGTEFWGAVTAQAVRDESGQICYFDGHMEDITARKLAQEALQEANRRLEELATTDELTGLWNRRRLGEMLKTEIDRALRQETALAIAMFDVDQFKATNDAYGHALGDQVLREVARMFRGAARATDVVARYGGDEVVVLMPDTSAVEAVAAAERIRQAVDHQVVSDGHSSVRVTLSAGVAALKLDETDMPDTLLCAADEALFAAKHSGRNCIRSWGQETGEAADETSVNREAVDRLRARVVALSRESREMFVRGVRGLVHAQEARDPYAKFHSENVAHFSACIARAMGLDAQQVAVVRRAGLLHDLGKIGVPDGILWKPFRLTDHERKLMQQHVVVGVRILDQLRFLEREVPLVRHHHERYDGGGYPDGIAGEAIPLGARILGVADALDAITADRPYRRAQPVHAALQMIVADAGRQFDPQVVDALLRWVSSASRHLSKVGDVTVADLCEGRPQETEPAEEVATL